MRHVRDPHVLLGERVEFEGVVDALEVLLGQRHALRKTVEVLCVVALEPGDGVLGGLVRHAGRTLLDRLDEHLRLASDDLDGGSCQVK
jgi:hypothetical protein